MVTRSIFAPIFAPVHRPIVGFDYWQRSAFDVLNLFKSNEQGVWYDPSDTATLFQDSAGTTPVTASGQPVGLMLDKSKGLVLGPELVVNGDFSGGSAGWTVTGTDGTHIATFSGGTLRYQSDTTTPALQVTQLVLTIGKMYEITVLTSDYVSGTLKSDSFGSAVVIADGPGSRTVRARATSPTLSVLRSTTNVDITLDSISVRELPGNHATQPTAASRPIYRRGDSRGVVNQLLNTETLATQSRAVTAVGHTLSFTGTGSITLSGASTAGPLVGTGVNDRVSLTFTPTAGSLTLTVSGSVTKGQLNLGPTALPYQRNDSHLGGVATGASTDLHWLGTDGVDDGMVTGNIDFTGTDKVSVFAGVRKLSDAARGMLFELGNISATGTFQLEAPIDASPSLAYVCKGTNLSSASLATGYASPVSLVVGAFSEIASDTNVLRTNGVVAQTSSADQGTGNFGNYPLYLFRRGGTTLPFNGWFYGLAITGRLTTDAETVATERYLAAKASVVIP